MPFCQYPIKNSTIARMMNSPVPRPITAEEIVVIKASVPSNSLPISSPSKRSPPKSSPPNRLRQAHRTKQIAYNEEHHIVPKSVKREINESAYVFRAGGGPSRGAAFGGAAANGGADEAATGAELVAELTRDMLEAADNLEFERAAYLRDQIAELRKRIADGNENVV